jgi:nucleoside-diphosphate kinase
MLPIPAVFAVGEAPAGFGTGRTMIPHSGRAQCVRDAQQEPNWMAERTFVMVKPDGVGRRLIGACMRRFEKRGLKLVGLKMQVISQELAGRHYDEHRERPFFPDLVAFITSGPTVQMVWEGNDAVAQVRKMNGATNSIEAAVGTIRGDYGLSLQNNVIHASDSVDTAKREIALYFQDSELLDYPMLDTHWLS